MLCWVAYKQLLLLLLGILPTQQLICDPYRYLELSAVKEHQVDDSQGIGSNARLRLHPIVSFGFSKTKAPAVGLRFE